MPLLHNVIALIGPTSSGKTSLSIQLALQYNAVIINLDSVQIYKELNIGSAKPSLEELNKVPHYLINIATIDEPKNSFYIFNKSYDLIKKLKPSTNIILTGGTGLYYKNLLWGMFQTPIFSKEYREELNLFQQNELWEKLSLMDPKATKIIHPHDKIRIIRALEVMYYTKKSIVELREEQNYTPPASFLLLGIHTPRDILYERINKKVLNMIEQGLVEELNNILKKQKSIPHLLYKIIGYKELIPFILGEENLELCIAKIQQNTRRYAKRQFTLFKHIPNIQWINEPNREAFMKYIY